MMFAQLFAYLRLFAHIPAADQAVIEHELRCKSLVEAAELTIAGFVCKEMFFICRGVLRITSQSEEGQYITYFFLKENQLFTILDSFTDQVPAKVSVQAASPAEVIVLTYAGLQRLYARLPYLRELIDRLMQRTLLEKIQVRNQYLGKDARERYEHFLRHQPDIAQRVSLHAAAAYLGITQQSLSRIRHQLA